MGSSSSKPVPKYKYINTGEGRLETRPENVEFEKRWDTFIQSLDVGPENVRHIDQLEPDQKEQLLLNFVCEISILLKKYLMEIFIKESKNPKCSASHYVNLIKALQTRKSMKNYNT